MVREDPTKVLDELRKDDDEYYGDEATGGTNEDLEADDSVDKRFTEVTGDEQHDDEPLDIAKEIDEAEEIELHQGNDADLVEEEEEEKELEDDEVEIDPFGRVIGDTKGLEDDEEE
jgi:hypothetical protein